MWWIALFIVSGLAIAFRLWRATRKWESGRQGSGYFKLRVFVFKYLDCHLVKFPNGSFIEKHTDPIDYGAHYRLNIVLIPAKEGGKFECEGGPLWSWSRFTLFRPDIQTHTVSKVKGFRLMITFGVVIPNEKH